MYGYIEWGGGGGGVLWILLRSAVVVIPPPPWLLFLLGKGVLSHSQIPLSILDFRDPSLDACTLGVFRSLGILPCLSGPDGFSRLLLPCLCVPSLLLFCGLVMRGILCGVIFSVGLLLRGWPLYCGLAYFVLCCSICVPVGCCMCSHRMGVSVMSVPLCHLG